MLSRKQAIATSCSSVMLFCLNAGVAKACAIPSQRTLFLELPPTILHEATFMGKVEVTRSTTLEYMTLVRGVLKESKTHPRLIGNKVTLIHEGRGIDYFCPMYTRGDGYEGYVIGREMKLNTDALIIDPYIADDFIGPVDEATIDTGKNKFPQQRFYEPGMEYFY